jgi:hypothetical protein
MRSKVYAQWIKIDMELHVLSHLSVYISITTCNNVLLIPYNSYKRKNILAKKKKYQQSINILQHDTSSFLATWHTCTGLLNKSARRITAAVWEPSACVHNGRCAGQCSKCWNKYDYILNQTLDKTCCTKISDWPTLINTKKHFFQTKTHI